MPGNMRRKLLFEPCRSPKSLSLPGLAQALWATRGRAGAGGDAVLLRGRAAQHVPLELRDDILAVPGTHALNTPLRMG